MAERRSILNIPTRSNCCGRIPKFYTQIEKRRLVKECKKQSLTFKTELKSLKLISCGCKRNWEFLGLEFNSQETNMKVRKQALGNGLITWECGERGECLGLVPPLNADLRIIEKPAELLRRVFRKFFSYNLGECFKAFLKELYLYLKVEGLKHTHHLFLHRK